MDNNEIELKLRIPSEDIAEALWENSEYKDIEEADSREEIRMIAKYYDTPGFNLMNKGIAYRTRRENNKMMATVKCGGMVEDGLHERREINVPVNNLDGNIGVFMESNVGEALAKIVGDEPLVSFMRVDFLRKRFRVDTGESILEFSVDKGEISTDYGTESLCELEIELFSGEAEEIRKLGDNLKAKYGLESEDKSKYLRGLNMVRTGR